ncbi:PBECR4 domain-containing protein [Bacillus wiedmannii]|uniref:PBECR4 domain-containing protein n=1 Tax=Bacillus wiedmannii TaxID=1890302 RepID=UPI000BEDEC4C|nr:PBECR4 domain-containing protein [Bacillus wiedmannii]PEF33675.1 hypothetical protein CON72_23690 [Bacillus wiedmannii]
MNDNKTLDSLQDGLAAYEKIVNKELHYVYYKNNQYYELVFKPHKRNFIHLCGIDYYDPKTGQKFNAIRFYDALKSKKISIKGIVKKSYADQKLQIIDQLKDLTTCSLRIIDEKATYLNLVFYRAIRSRKKIFALALENEARSGFYVPCSLLNLKNTSKGNSIKAGYPVHCIYSVDSKTRNVQSLCKTPEFLQYEESHTYLYKSKLERI